MTEPSEDRDPLDELGEEFLSRYRRGERPDIGSYAARDPENAKEIREFLSALLMVEGLKPQADQTVDAFGRSRPGGGAVLEHVGDFRIVRELGRGGMGVVYEAEQQSLGRRVALKILAPGTRGSQQVRRFLREARSAARLHHTNIVPVFGVGDHDGLHYYAMQYIPGLGLDKVLEEVRRLKGHADRPARASGSTTRLEAEGSLARSTEPNETDVEVSPGPAPAVAAPASLVASTDSEGTYARAVARIGLQIAEALEYAHRQGTLHRDVKPSNILLDLHGVAWVTDFGLAKAAEDEDLTRTGDIVGTIRYMAPERFRGHCDAASDVYGLGLALYELLALRPAFDASDRERLLYQVSHEDPPRLSAVNPALPRDLETIVHKAIEKERAHRYRTAAELAEDLRRFLEDRPILARRVGSTERLTRWARRNPGLATLATAVAAMLALVMVVVAAANVRLRRQHGETLFQLRRAERAEEDALSQLLASHVNHARASRRSRFAGRRFEALRAIGQAARLRHSVATRLELRDEAIACLALADVRPRDPWPGRAEDGYLGVDFDPVTGRLARGLPDGTIAIRGAEGQGEVRRLPGNDQRPVLLRFSRDGRRLAVKHERGGIVHVTVWDVERAEKILDVPEGMYGDAIDFHPDGHSLATGRRDGSVVVHDLTGKRAPRRLPPGTVPRVLRFDPSGERIVVVSSNSREGVQIRRLSDGEVVAVWEIPGQVFAADWHPSGQAIAVGSDDGRIRILDAASPTRPPRLFEAHDGQVITVAFHPAGGLLASASWDGSLRLWDVRTGRELVRAPSPEARPIRFSQEGAILGPGQDLDASWLWDVAAAEECRMMVGAEGPASSTWAVGFLEPHGVLVSAGEAGVRLEASGQEGPATFLSLPGTSDVAVAPDGSALFTSSTAGVFRWPVRRPSAAELRVGPPEPLPTLAGFPTGRIRFGGRGQSLAVVVDSERGRVRVVDIQGRAAPVTVADHRNAERLALSPDGRWLATGTWQGTRVKVWALPDGSPATELPVEGSAEVLFSPSGDRLLTASGREYVLWEPGTWRPLVRIARSQSSGLPGVACFSPDGRVLAVARTRSTVQLIDPATGGPHATLEAPEPRNVSGLGFSPDGRHLAVGLNGPRLLNWDLAALRKSLDELALGWSLPRGPLATLDVQGTPTIVVEHAPWLTHLEQSETLARAGSWDDAGSALDRAIASGAPHVDARVRRILFHRAREDESAYRDACRDLLKGFPVADLSPRAINDIAWTCALGAGATDDYGPLIELARINAVSRPVPNRLNTLGALLYRAGRYPEAIRHLNLAVDAHGAGGTAYDALFLAMAHHRLGQVEEARRWFRRGQTPPPVATFKPDGVGDTSWIPQLELEILRREVAAVINPPAN